MNGRGLLMLGAGFTLWAAAFVVLYAMLSVGCRFGWDGIELAGGITLQRAQLVAIFLASLAAGAALAAGLRAGAGASFLARAAYVAAIAGLAAIAFSFAGVFALSACV